MIGTRRGLRQSAALAVIVTALMVAASPCHAQDGHLIDAGGSDSVVVWRSADAQRTGQAMIRSGEAKASPAMLIPYIACVVPSGTKAVITSRGFRTHDIRVTEGEEAGCTGNVPVGEFKTE